MSHLWSAVEAFVLAAVVATVHTLAAGLVHL
jgi:hypothetical protein